MASNKSIGLLNIVFGADLRGFDRAMKKAQRSIGKFGRKMQSVGKNLSTRVTLPIVGLGVAAVKMASDFEETDSKFKTVFSSIEEQAESTAQTFRESFGLSAQSAKDLLSSTGDLLVGFGFTEESALGLSTQVNELAVDLASFTNFSGGAKGASEALTKALLGERESIKSLGIAITETDLKKFAADQGLVWKELDRVAKANLTFQLATKQSSKAIGDFERTQGSLANQTRQLQENLKDLGVEFGTILIPLAQELVSSLRELSAFMMGLSDETKENIVKFLKWAAIVGPIVFIAGKLVTAFKVLLPLIAKIGKSIAKNLGVWGKLAVLVLATGKGIYQMITGQRKLTDLEKELAKGTQDLNAELEKENKLLEVQSADIDNLNDKLPALTEKTKEYSDSLQVMQTDFIYGMSPIEEQFENMSTWTIDMRTEAEKNADALKSTLTDMAAEMGATLAQGAEDFQAFGNMVLNSVRDVIKALIAQGVASAVAAALKNPVLAVAPWLIPVIAGVAAGLANTAFSSLVPAFAQGGLVSGPTLGLIGEGSGTSAMNPEVVAPLDKLMGMMGATQVDVHGRIEGNNIVLISDKAEISRKRFI
tara:strand:+ start:4575 stop:6353 length:1779 start_codon:yes stop_codon:yes gene_type:complete